jgi:Na+:H+ antiporter, NhaA family
MAEFENHQPSGGAGAAVGGVLLFLCALAAILWSNSSYGEYYARLVGWHAELSIMGKHVPISVHLIVNDVLMSLFFLLVGLELKREILEGELSSRKSASLPAICAAGGMLFPALIYLGMNQAGEERNGWGIPTATDIAFSLAALSMFGNRLPSSLKVFLSALAIVDDLGAILIIALFYTEGLNFQALSYGMCTFAMLLTLNRWGNNRLAIFLFMGVLLWAAIFFSGIHATIAGVLLAMTIPHSTIPRSKDNSSRLLELEHALKPLCIFFIMPLFAFVNSGVTFANVDITGGTITYGTALGLFAGKPLGIWVAAYVAVKLKAASLPSRAGWMHLLGIGFFAGIGFTMSLFISTLAFSNAAMDDQAKIGILAGSFCSAAIGALILSRAKRVLL